MSYYERLLKPRNKIYNFPHDFMRDAVDYFQWADNNPLLEDKVQVVDKCIVHEDLEKVRAFTKAGLCSYLNIPTSRLDGYKKRGGEWAEAMEMIEQVMFAQKFENAAAGLLKEGIVSRELGLAEKQEVETVDLTPPPPPVSEEHQAVHIHPDDPDPLDLPRPMYSRAQIAAGVQFSMP